MDAPAGTVPGTNSDPDLRYFLARLHDVSRRLLVRIGDKQALNLSSGDATSPMPTSTLLAPEAATPAGRSLDFVHMGQLYGKLKLHLVASTEATSSGPVSYLADGFNALLWTKGSRNVRAEILSGCSTAHARTASRRLLFTWM